MATREELLQEKRRYGLPEVISTQEQSKLDEGMPVQKIMGYIEFDKVRINVERDVLIPRYETEEVVHEALKFINEESNVLDLCTGSGYIGLTIKDKTNATVTMSDVSNEAILQASENAKLNNLDVTIIKSDMFQNIKQKFNVIVSNPPYIPFKNKISDSVINFEPKNALFASEDGNYFYRVIDENASKFLEKEGIVVLEISEDNVDFLKKRNFKIIDDINGKPRIAVKVYN